MKKSLIAAALFSVSAAAISAPPPEAATCAGCHGMDGKSANPAWPNLAGQNKDYLISSIKAYRDGGRDNPLMSPMAKPLSDEAIEKLANYFSGL